MGGRSGVMGPLLTKAQIERIRDRVRDGVPAREIARMMGVSATTVWKYSKAEAITGEKKDASLAGN